MTRQRAPIAWPGGPMSRRDGSCTRYQNGAARVPVRAARPLRRLRASPGIRTGNRPRAGQATPGLTPIAPGLGLWLQIGLLDAGHSPVPLAGDLRDASARAAGRGLSRLLITRLQEDAGTTHVQLVLYASGTDTPLAGVRRSAPTAELGRATAEAFAALLPQLGSVPDQEPSRPLLEDLAGLGVALRARAEGDLIGAWKALAGKLSPISLRLREQIVTDARQSGGPAPMRARVLAAAGDLTNAWGLIGRAATDARSAEDPDLEVLLAAGEVRLASGDVQDARAYFERVLRAQPDHVDGAVGLARALELQGDVTHGLKWLERAARLEPDDPDLAERLATLRPDPEIGRAHV